MGVFYGNGNSIACPLPILVILNTDLVIKLGKMAVTV
jgi:hypothetical protein